MAEKKETKTVTLDYKYAPDMAKDIQFVNVFRFSHIGSDVYLDIGVYDHLKMVAELNKPNDAKPEKIETTVVKKYAISVTTFLNLRATLEEHYKKMKKGGVFDKMGLEE